MLAFVHIPKTAGTTLHKILSHNFPRKSIHIHHDSDGPASEELAESLLKKGIRLVMGHQSVGLHRFIPEVRYVTCLRDPVARLRSHYHHAKSDPAHYLHNAIVTQELDFERYVTSGLSGELSNGMTRMLAGMESFHDTSLPPDFLQTAKRNLSELFLPIVFTESFDSCLLDLASSQGWSTPYYIRRKVGKSEHLHLPQAAPESVILANQLDLELYGWAKNLSAVANPQNPASLANFGRKNRNFGWFVYLLRELRSRLALHS